MCRKQHHHQPHQHHHHDHTPQPQAVSRRQMLAGLGVTGLLAAGSVPALASTSVIKTLEPIAPAAAAQVPGHF